MAVLLALVSALGYGLSDFVGGLVSRRVSAWSVAFLAGISATVCTAVVALVVPGSPAPADLWWAVLAGFGSGVGTGFLYRGFSSGRMGVVAPVSAVGAAVVPVAVGALTGERPSLLVWVGIVLAMPGIWLVASEPADDLSRIEPADGPGRVDDARARRGLADGLVDGLVAGLAFGVLFAALGQVPDSAGLWPLVLAQAVSVPVVVLLATALRASWVPRGGFVHWAWVAGPLGAVAVTAFLLASQRGFLTVAGVLASLYPAVTVLLAALVLRERVHRAQGVGLGLCAVAVAMVAAG
ncbi:MAG: EamA family transporter [Actinomycetes bacterium]